MTKRTDTEALAPASSAADQEGSNALPDRFEFTKARLDNLLRTGRPHRQKSIWDTREKGLCVLISRGPAHKRQATVTLRVVYYLKDRPGKPRYFKLGRYPDDYPNFNIGTVRDDARSIRTKAKKGIDPKRKVISGNFAEIVARYIDEHVKSNRTWQETKRILDVYVVPEWADKNIETITKSDVSVLLQQVADGKIRANGKKVGTPAVAWAVRARLVTLFNWYVDEHGSDEFRSPIVKTKKTQQWKPKDRSRVLGDDRMLGDDRVLGHDELRALWTACGEMGAYGAVVKSALLTAQRFRKVGQMRRADLKERVHLQGSEIGNVWDPSRESDPANKKVSAVPLSRLARQVIDAVPPVDADKGKDYVFSVNGREPIKSWSSYKERLDRRMLALLQQWAAARGDDPEAVVLEPWQHRDLRRTARTFMARIGVDSKIGEHALGHALRGVEGIYNRHHYLSEKRAAFEALAAYVERIVNPSPANVVVPFTR